MNIAISLASDKPLYQQLFDQLSAQILRGEMKEGFVLPPIRTVAKELRISVITVKKAWEELERAGFIVTMVGKGCFVAPMGTADLSGKRDELVLAKLKKDIEYYKELGLSKDALVNLVRTHYDE